jgi:MFS transporter, NNP family, nitrate/nitrite transporter
MVTCERTTAIEGNRSNTNLALATLGFGLCFAVCILISPLAPRFRQTLGLTDFQTGLLIAAPSSTGTAARIPMGMLTDRYGGRIVFAALKN